MPFGYHFDDIKAFGVMSDEGGTVSNLNNPIHPLWKHENFNIGNCVKASDLTPNQRMQGDLGWDRPETEFPEILYRRAMPALHLATLLLEGSRPFLMKILFADMAPIPVGSHPDATAEQQAGDEPLEIFATDYRPAPWHGELLDANLKNIAENYRIFVDINGPTAETYGATHFVADRTWPIMGELAQTFFQPLLSPYWDTSSAPAMRSNYLLAVTCVHEIAHALFDWRSLDENWIRANRGLKSVREPLDTLTDPCPELGWALEKWLYGGISEFNGDIFPVSALGLSWSPWNSDAVKELDIILGESYVQYRALSSGSLAKLFDAAAWSSARSEPVNIGLTTMRAMMVNLEKVPDLEPD